MRFSGVQFGTSPNDSGFRVRGVGTLGGFSSASESPVGLVVDGVVTGIGSPVESLGDLERIEVLKGPQGTQFGKNASSGVISITTVRPDLERFGGSFFASYGELSERDINGSLNIPTGSNSAFNLYVFDRDHDGYVRNTVRNEVWGGQHRYGARAKFLWEASETFSVYVIGDYSRRKQEGPGQIWTLNKLAPGAQFALPFVNLAALGVVPGPENEVSIENGAGFYDVENSGASLELNWGLGEYGLTSLSAFRQQKENPYTYAIDGAPYTKFKANAPGETRRFFSEELRLTSPSGNNLEYVAGAFFSRQETGLGDGQSATLSPAQPFNSFPTISITAGKNVTRTTSDSAALFADGSFRLTEQLRLIGGLRINQDKVSSENFSTIDPTLPPFNPPPPFGTGPSGTVSYSARALQTDDVSKTSTSGRLGMDFKLTPDVLLYGTVARGYLGPTVTFSGLTGTKSLVAAQTVDDLTIGAKTQFFDRTLTVNVNAFYDKYTDLQTSVFNGTEFLTENAGGAKATGFELELTVRPTANLTVNASLTYSDAKFTDYITTCPTPIVQRGQAAARCNAPGSTAGTPLFQAEGEPLPGAPKITGVLGMNYDRSITDGLKFDFSANWASRSETQNSVANPDTIQPGYGIVNASTGIGAADGSWRVAIFARNLFDQNFNNAILGLPFADAGSYVNWRNREAMRTVGGSVEVRF